MKRHITYITQAVVLVLKERRYKIVFPVASFLFFGLFIYLPVWTTPGNDLFFQLSLFTIKDYVLLVTLSLLTALSTTLNGFVIRRQFTTKDGFNLLAQGGGGSLSAMAASVFGTASCSTCVGALFGFLGFGGILFLLKYRTVIAVGVVVLMLISLYFTSKRVLGICEIKKSK